MMTADQISSFVDSKASKSCLVGIRDLFFFVSPVEDHDRDDSSLFFYLGDILFQLFCPLQMIFQFINPYKTDFDSFYFYDSSLIISKVGDAFLIESCQGIGKTLFPVIVAVVVGQRDSFYCTIRENTGKFCRSFKGKLFFFSLFRIRKCSFKIGNGQVIGGKKYLLHYGKNIQSHSFHNKRSNWYRNQNFHLFQGCSLL